MPATKKASQVPRYRLTVSPDESRGVQLISLVASPAIEAGWVALAAETTPPVFKISLATEGRMKQVVTGPVLIPDKDILRLDKKKKPFYIFFSAEDIEQAAARFLAQGLTTAASEQHAQDENGHAVMLSGPAIRESWFVEDAEAEGYPVGTWMVSMHIPNEEVWQKIVDQELTGFSLEGLFDPQIESQIALAAVEAESATSAPPMKNLFFAALWAALPKSWKAKLGAETLEDGTSIEITDTGEVFSVDAEGVRGSALADGEYKLADGSTLTVKDGKQEGFTAPTADTKLSKETEVGEVKLETVEMADGSTLTMNPLTRLISGADGQLVPSGYYACKDGSYVRIETSQYYYTIDADTYQRATKLEAVEVKLSEVEQTATAKDATIAEKEKAIADLTAQVTELKAQVAAKPSSDRVKLGGEKRTPASTNDAPDGLPVALSRLDHLRRREGAQTE